MEQCYRHFDHQERPLIIGGGKRTSASEKLADACGAVIPASVANGDAIAGVAKGISHEGRRSSRALDFDAEQNAIV